MRANGVLDATGKAPRLSLSGRTARLPCVRGPGESAVALALDLTFDQLRTAKMELGATTACEPRPR